MNEWILDWTGYEGPELLAIAFAGLGRLVMFTVRTVIVVTLLLVWLLVVGVLTGRLPRALQKYC